MAGMLGQRVLESQEPLAAGGGGGRAFEDDDRAAPRKLAEQIARDVSGKRPVVRADEGDPPARRRAGDDVEQRNSCRVEAEDGVVHRGLVHRHEHRGVGPLRNRLRDQSDLLRHAVGLFGNVVDGGGAEPRRGAVGAQPRRLIGRIGAVFGEDGDAGHAQRLQMLPIYAASAAICRARLEPFGGHLRCHRATRRRPTHETIPESGTDQGPRRQRRHDRPRRRHRLFRQGGADAQRGREPGSITSIGSSSWSAPPRRASRTPSPRPLRAPTARCGTCAGSRWCGPAATSSMGWCGTIR